MVEQFNNSYSFEQRAYILNRYTPPKSLEYLRQSLGESFDSCLLDNSSENNGIYSEQNMVEESIDWCPLDNPYENNGIYYPEQNLVDFRSDISNEPLDLRTNVHKGKQPCSCSRCKGLRIGTFDWGTYNMYYENNGLFRYKEYGTKDNHTLLDLRKNGGKDISDFNHEEGEKTNENK